MKSFSALIVLSVLFASGEALKCYSCGFQANLTCDNPFKKSVNVTESICTNNEFCVKRAVELTNGTYIQRGCSLPRPLNYTQHTITQKSDKALPIKSYSEYYCEKDFCNGASSFTTAISTTMGLVMTVLVAKCK